MSPHDSSFFADEKRQRVMHPDDTPEKRIARMVAMQTAAMKVLQGNAEGYRAYLKRNFSARSVKYIDGTWQPISRDHHDQSSLSDQNEPVEPSSPTQPQG